MKNIQWDLKPEDRLLLLCTRLRQDDQSRREMAGWINSGLDWDYLVEMAHRYGIAPRLYHHLRQAGENSRIPQTVMAGLRWTYHANAYRNLSVYDELAKVLKAFKAAGIRVIALEGAALAEIVYGADTGLRSIGDIALLARKSDLSKARGMLREMGHGQPNIFGRFDHLPNFVKKDPLVIEVCWTIEYHPTVPFKIDIDGLWSRAQPVMVAGVEILTLSPEDLLLYLSLHLAYRHKSRLGLRALGDIAETIRYYGDEIAWPQVQLRARRWNADRWVFPSLWLARELLKAAVPDTAQPGLPIKLEIIAA